MDKLYLVTGGTGHLGNIIINKLSVAGCNVRALILPGESISGCKESFVGDVRDRESLRPFFSNAEYHELIVIHTAGIVSISSEYNRNVYDVNVNGTKNIVDLCQEYGVSKLIYVSSVHAIPEMPMGQMIIETKNFSPEKVKGLYAKTKAEATAYVLDAQEKLHVNIVHPSGICGPYDYRKGYLTALITDYCNGGLVAIIRGGYDFVDVRDVADGIISCCEKGKKGECYILSNKYFSIQEIVYMLYEITKKKEIKLNLPLWFAMLTSPLAELYYKILGKPPLYTSYSLYTLQSNSYFSHEKAEKELGYSVTDMKKTLSDTVEWLNRYHYIK